MLAKAARASAKDMEYLEVAVRNGIADLDVLAERLKTMDLPPGVRKKVAGRLAGLRAEPGPS